MKLNSEKCNTTIDEEQGEASLPHSLSLGVKPVDGADARLMV